MPRVGRPPWRINATPLGELPTASQRRFSPVGWYMCSAAATAGSWSKKCGRAMDRFPGFNPLVELSLSFHTPVVGSNGQRQAMFLENVSGLAARILRNFDISTGRLGAGGEFERLQRRADSKLPRSFELAAYSWRRW